MTPQATWSYDITNVATPGWGYWIKVNSSTSIDMVGQPITSNTFDIALGSSWNQIGNPYNATAAWNTVQFIKGGVNKTLAEASAAGWVSQIIYNYDTINRMYQTSDASNGVLVPMVGYWLKAYQPDITMRIVRP